MNELQNEDQFSDQQIKIELATKIFESLLNQQIYITLIAQEKIELLDNLESLIKTSGLTEFEINSAKSEAQNRISELNKKL